jgi:hypothetical protein
VKDTISGKPSSAAWNPALEMAFSLSCRGSSGMPTETVAKEDVVCVERGAGDCHCSRIEAIGAVQFRRPAF